MTENAKQAPKRTYASITFQGIRTIVDYVGTAVFRKATDEVEGIKAEILHKGFDLETLSDSKAFEDFKAWAAASGGTLAQIMQGYLQWRHTKVVWPSTEGANAEDWAKACQSYADSLALETQRAKGETVKVSKAKAAVLSGIEADAAEAGMTVEEYRAMVKAMIAKRTAKK